MKLVISEKKELAEAICDSLPGTLKKNGYLYEKGEYIVTYLAGHALCLKTPPEVDSKYAEWKKEDLPIFFIPWPKKIVSGKEKMLSEISKQLKNCEYVIHAGDNDDEGQYLVDEVLEKYGYKGKVLRLNTSNTTVAGLKKAFENLEDNSKHISSGKAAEARQLCDAGFGYTLSRYFTLLNKRKLTIGRVQTPTLGLVVDRDLKIESHKKSYYYNLFSDIKFNENTVRAKFIPQKDSDILVDGKSPEKIHLENLGKNLSGKTFELSITHKELYEKAPLPFNLVKLQTYCNVKWGYSPNEVMEITQTLRDKYKAITYNRSDCQYLTDEHFAEAPSTSNSTLTNLGISADDYDINPEIKSRAFNGKFVSLHFAIIPSGEPINVDDLPEKEKNVYIAIAKRYLMQFIPDIKKEKADLKLELPEGNFNASETKIIYPGFKIIDDYTDDESEEDLESTGLFSIPEGNYQGLISSYTITESETKPPKRYTIATLNEDLTRIVKYVTDPEIKELLLRKDDGKKGENGSIGTSATRAAIIDNLIKRGYIEIKGKNIISTSLGRSFYTILPDEIKKADTTALWWSHQEAIIEGREAPAALTDSVLSVISHVMETNTTATLVVENTQPSIGKCPICGNDVIHISNSKLKAYKCVSQTCDFILWENQYGTKISDATARKIILGKETSALSFKSKAGKEYKAKLKLSEDKTHTELIFANKERK